VGLVTTSCCADRFVDAMPVQDGDDERLTRP
jgi:hypothetical protein